MSVLSLLSYINLNILIILVVVQRIVYKQIVGCYDLKTNFGVLLCEGYQVSYVNFVNELVSYITMPIPLFLDVVYTYSPLLSQHVVHFIILYPCVVCIISVPITKLHKHTCIYTILLLLWYECVLFAAANCKQSMGI